MASSCHGVVDPTVAVCGGRDQLRTCGIEAHVQDLVVVATQRVHTGAATHVPHLPIRSGLTSSSCSYSNRATTVFVTLQVLSMDPEMHRSEA